MNLRKRLREQGEVQTSALNDILFILLFFFLIIAMLANPNVIKLANPQAESDSREKQTVAVSVDKDQNFYVKTKPVNFHDLKQQLATELQGYNAAEPPVIVINVDSAAAAWTIPAIMQVAKELKARTVMAVAKP